MDCIIRRQPDGGHKSSKRVTNFKKLVFYEKTGGSRSWGRRLVFTALLAFAVLLSPSLHARQESARINFQKTVGKRADRIHVVKKGESLLAIIKTIPNRKPGALALIKRLNPLLRNVNIINPGQEIILPSYENGDIPVTDAPVEKRGNDKPVSYRIKKNDSISRIILSKLKSGFNGRELTAEETITVYRHIRKLNPDMDDMNNLPAGHTLLLPPNGTDLSLSGQRPVEQEALPVIEPGRKEPDADKKDENPKTNRALSVMLTSIRPVIERMKGSLNTTGNYFIPLPENSQLTIDSALIPSVELDDGTVVFLDYENRLNDAVRQLIRQYWHNYVFLKDSELQSVSGALQGIIGHSRNYSMARVEKPFMLTSKPDIAIFPDWIITGNRRTEGAGYRQVIFQLAPGEPPLPDAVKLFLEKNGLAVTQFSREIILSRGPENQGKSQIAREDLRNLQGPAFADRLLTAIGENPIRRVPVGIFKQSTDGFNLSVMADILLSKGERKLIINSKKLPDQFLKILADSGFEVLTIGENDKGRLLVESVLRGAGLSASFGYYSLRVPKEGKISRFDASFSALSSMNDTGRIYFVDFDLPDWFLPLLYSGPRALVIRY